MPSPPDVSSAKAPTAEGKQVDVQAKPTKDGVKKPVSVASKAAERKKRKEAVIYTSDIYTGMSMRAVTRSHVLNKYGMS